MNQFFINFKPGKPYWWFVYQFNIIVIYSFFFSCFRAYGQDIPSQPVPVLPDLHVFCGYNNGYLSTMVEDSSGRYPLIWWVQDYYSETGEDALSRCTRVSAIFRNFLEQGILSFITYGEVRGQTVICAASEPNGECDRVIYELQPEENPQEEVENLLRNLQRNNAGGWRGDFGFGGVNRDEPPLGSR